ncbi:hypothetical protein ACFW2V_13435 [Streptomyces sp. NPDC058947]|uniref:hypothetical protein n=1 Tax=Streptomyces sp. NPDC058947 TaxID=3346675 RepID=UPI003682C2F4
MLDSWTITDADETWDFQVEVTNDESGMRPEQSGDVYNADTMAKIEGTEAAQWARDAVEAWERDDWCFAVISVTPVLKASDVTFGEARQVLGGCDWGWLPGGEDGKGVWTSDHDYAQEAWINDMIIEAKGEAAKLLDKIKKSI